MIIYGAGSIEDIKECGEIGVAGILTNPQGFDQYFHGEMTLKEITEAIIAVTDVPVFIQIQAETTDGLVLKAHELHAVSPRVGFKILSDEKGFRAIRILQKEGIKCIATCLFSLSQASVAATVGAYGICPFISRARDIGIDPYELISKIRKGYNQLESAPKIIGVSFKTVADIDLALSAGSDAVAMRYPLLKEMMRHVMTEKAEALFAKNWANVKEEKIEYLEEYLQINGMAE